MFRCALQKIYAFSMQHTELRKFLLSNSAKFYFTKKNQLKISIGIFTKVLFARYSLLNAIRN